MCRHVKYVVDNECVYLSDNIINYRSTPLNLSKDVTSVTITTVTVKLITAVTIGNSSDK